MIKRAIPVFAMSCVLAATSHVQAQDVGAGERMAQTWCSNCHVVDAAQQKAGNDGVPSFPSIARRASTTQMSLTVFLSTPHGRMPDYSLTRTEIGNVAAYILSLRDKP
jgi:mono/diheme cytochrome c family protein